MTVKIAPPTPLHMDDLVIVFLSGCSGENRTFSKINNCPVHILEAAILVSYANPDV